MRFDVVVLGGGFAGVACAQVLGRKLYKGERGRVALISADNHMVFQPMLPEVVGGSVSPRHIVNPLRLLCRHLDVFRGVVESVDWGGRTLTLHAGDFSGRVEFGFGQLVLALGAIIDLSRIPGMPEHALLMQNVGDAMRLRATLINRIEEANLESDSETRRRLLAFVVVGGGFSGVETAGQILDLFEEILRFYPRVSRKEVQVWLVHSGDRLLPAFDPALGAYAARSMQERGLHLILGGRVKSVTARTVYLEGGRRIETNTVVSAVGNAPHPLVQKVCHSGGFAHERGRIITDSTLRVPGSTHLWAAGDCAAIPSVEGGFCPATAQFAERQGKLVAENIIRFRASKPLLKFDFREIGQLATVGHHHGIALIKGIRLSGFLAWWVWRTVYLTKLPGFDRKLRVVLDWTLDLFFPRDINLLNPRYTLAIKEIYLEQEDLLFRTGEPSFSYYVVKSGCIEIRDGDAAHYRVEPGQYIGGEAVLENGAWRYDAIATESSVLVSVPSKTFRQIADAMELEPLCPGKGAANGHGDRPVESPSRTTTVQRSPQG